MGTRGDEEDEDCFFDAPEQDVTTTSSASQEEFGLHLWTEKPESVSSRRRKFLLSMGFSFKKTAGDEDAEDVPLSEVVDDRVEEKVDLLSRNESTTSSGFDHSTVSSEDTDDQSLVLSRNDSSSSTSLMPEGLTESGSSRSGSDFDNSPSSSRRYDSLKRGGAQSWLKKLGVLTHVLESLDCEGMKRVAKVQTYKKQFRELSSLCVDQDFAAHDGSVLAMKFSHDGKYIASAGEDCVVRVWSVIEEERTDKYEVASEVDSNGVYFGMNQHSPQIEPLNNLNKEKVEKKTSFLRKSSDSTCVVLPSKTFSLSEKPLHEFRGHVGEILDLSWSDKGYLLSSSVDETVRLWRVGSDECLRTFPHNNFVTCVAFNPVDDNYFISGSIDGKVRVWDVSRCRVVDYTDIRDIVTAVCFRPDAKGVVIGSMTGNCRFYHILDKQLQMDREINLHGKKKVSSKRITGLEFLPNDPDKVMVTSADSKIRIISGDDVICKLKASSLRTTSASFILDGKNILSTSEDSGIHLWDYSQCPSKKPSSEKPKSIRSYEGFLSHNASVAAPWLRQGIRNSLFDCITELENNTPKVDCFSPMKGSTTWPEEKLDETGTVSNSRGNMKLLRRSVLQPHLWGLVVVTATWDGRIRVFHNYGLPVRV